MARLVVLVEDHLCEIFDRADGLEYESGCALRVPHACDQRRRASHVLRAEALATDKGIMLINKSTDPQPVEVSGLRGAKSATLQTLDASTFDTVRQGGDPPVVPVEIMRGRLSLTLQPCAVVWVKDWD